MKESLLNSAKQEPIKIEWIEDLIMREVAAYSPMFTQSKTSITATNSLNLEDAIVFLVGFIYLYCIFYLMYTYYWTAFIIGSKAVILMFLMYLTACLKNMIRSLAF